MQTYRPPTAAVIQAIKWYEALTVEPAPRGEGVLDDAAWAKAEKVTGFTEIITGSGPAQDQTVFSVLYDRDKLYLRIECQEPKIGELKSDHSAHDSQVSADDCVEIFLDTHYDRLNYYHFVANSIGARYEGRRYDGSWDAPWEAKARIGGSSWFLDIAIPFSSLGNTPVPGDLWGLNVCRTRQAAGAYILSCWSPTEKQAYRGYHIPGKFGMLLFGGARGCVKAKFLPAWQERVEEVSAEFADDLLAFIAPDPQSPYFPERTGYLSALYEELAKQPKGERVYKYPLPAESRAGMTRAQAGWIDAKTIELKGGLKVSLSQPVLVARSKGFLWFPSVFRMEDGNLMATMSNGPDYGIDKPVSSVSWSLDGGFTWLEPRRILSPGCPWLKLVTGELLSHLLPRPDGLSKGGNRLAGGYLKTVKGKLDLQVVDDEFAVTGWPRPLRDGSGAGWAWNRQTIPLKAGGYLATLAVDFKDAARNSVAAAESVDGRHWKIRSVIADETCKLKGGEGPNETGLCRLRDGRLMCVWRNSGDVPYGQSWSQDEGRTWTEPVAMVDHAGSDMGSVVPNLAVMKGGTVALFGGRPGLFLWINVDGTGRDWQTISVHEHHSALHPEEPIGGRVDGSSYLSSTCNNDFIALDETHLLLIYDRVPHGWNHIPAGSPDSNSVWVMRVEITRDK